MAGIGTLHDARSVGRASTTCSGRANSWSAFLEKTNEHSPLKLDLLTNYYSIDILALFRVRSRLVSFRVIGAKRRGSSRVAAPFFLDAGVETRLTPNVIQ